MSTVTLTVPQDTWWVHDDGGVVVVHDGQAQWLVGVEAMVWSWLTLGYSFSMMADMLTLARSNTAYDLIAILRRWQACGIVIEEQ